MTPSIINDFVKPTKNSQQLKLPHVELETMSCVQHTNDNAFDCVAIFFGIGCFIIMLTNQFKHGLSCEKGARQKIIKRTSAFLVILDACVIFLG